MNKDVSEIELPVHAHLPGENARHPEGFLDHVIDLAPDTTLSQDASSNIPFQYGLRLLEEGFYWEAHEVLEAVWMNAVPNSKERHLLQGIIHIANASLKLKLKRLNAAQRLKALADDCIARAYIHDEDNMGFSKSEVEQLCTRHNDL